MTMVELIDKGGPVVWVLIGYSIVGLTLLLERLLHFAALGRLPADLENTLTTGGNAVLAVQLPNLRGPEGRLLRGVAAAAQQGVEDLGRVATRIGSVELQRLERGFRTLAILGNTAPLLGLLGTVLGMIKAFMVIEAAGGRVDAQALAGGIWEAMLTTGVGLTVALPLLLGLHFLEGAADRRAQSMRRYASLLIERTPHRPGEEPEAAVHHQGDGPHAV